MAPLVPLSGTRETTPADLSDEALAKLEVLTKVEAHQESFDFAQDYALTHFRQRRICLWHDIHAHSYAVAGGAFCVGG